MPSKGRFSARKRKISEKPESGPLSAEATPYDLADAYRVMKAKYLHEGHAGAQIESFNDFVNVKIPKCLSEYPPVVVVHEPTDSEYIVEIMGVRYDRPSVREASGEHRYVTPHECHLRRMSYTFNMLVTAKYIIREKSTGKIKHSVIFRDKVFDKLPCMKYSEFCAAQVDPEALIEDEADPGGYFLSTGAEKVIVGQEGQRTNFPFVFEDSDGTYKCECRSFNESRFRSTSTLYINLTPSHKTDTLTERRTVVPRVMVRIPFVSDPLPLPVTFKLLGVETPEQMLEHICAPSDPDWFKQRAVDILVHNVDALITPRDAAVTRLAHDRGQPYSGSGGSRKRQKIDTDTEAERCAKQVAGLISTEFLPHQGFSIDSVPAKAVLFGEYVRKLMRVYYHLQKPDNRDHYMHRRVQLSSSLMALLFRKQFTMWRRRLASQIRHELNTGSQFVTIKYLLQANIGGSLGSALSSGNFSMQRGQNNMDGVAQVLSRTEPHAPLSHVQRTSNPMNKDGRSVPPRLQDPSTIGIIGPWETPEGQSCGLMRNRAPMSGVRVGYPQDVMVDAVMATGMVLREVNVPLGLRTSTPVYVSGTLVGVADRPDALLDYLRRLRAVQDIPFDVSIYRTSGEWATSPTNEIHINADPGSFWWPLIRVDRLPQLRDTLDHITDEDSLWGALLSEGIIEAVNKDEEAASVRVALDKRMLASKPPGTYTHVVIHPSQICTVFESKGPLLEFNQSPRITYQAAMGKQAIGRPMQSHKIRVDTAAHALWTPQRALVSTFMDETLGADGVVSVQNPTVAILCSGGHNIEDSIIVNRAAFERGLFRSFVTRTIRDVVRITDAEQEILGIPPEGCQSKLQADYSLINPETGTVDPGTKVGANVVLVAKYVRMTRKIKETDPVTGEVRDIEEVRMRDRSTISRSREEAVVEDVFFTKTLEGDQSVRIKMRSMRTPEVGGKYACFSSDTEIQAERGWIPITNVITGEKIATLNPTTFETEYHPVEAVYQYAVENQDMCRFQNDQIDLLVTPNHQMVVVRNRKIETPEARTLLSVPSVHLNTDGHVCVDPSEVSVNKYTGSVHCVTVKHHIVYVRRNGIPVWCGNSRYGQKGTIGAMYNAEDMPFNPKTGMSPSLMINAHAIPSRMTLGHLLETLMGKTAALEGKQMDGTPFVLSEELSKDDDHDAVINSLGDRLEKLGMDRTGEEFLIDGHTGKYLKCKVFMGPISYHKLKHMVLDKYHARTRGPRNNQTRQAVEGRGRDGGLRFGEMEGDNTGTHGAEAFKQERLLHSSDKSTTPICTKCGELAQPPKRQAGNALFRAAVHANRPFCHNCLSHDTVTSRDIPFAYNVSVQELQGLHVHSGFMFD